MKVNKGQRTMAQRYKVNFFDGCTARELEHSDRCYNLHGKTSNTVNLVTDGGFMDLFCQDGFYYVRQRPNNKPKVGWLGEPRMLNGAQQRIYNSIETQYAQGTLFDDQGFDYIYTHDAKLLDLDPRFRFLLGNGFQIKRPRIHQKTKTVSMITTNKNLTEGHRLRLELVEQYKNRIDVFGSGFDYIRLKEQGLNDYCFSIAVENVKTDTWITEKVLDCFATGTIPVYWGTDRIRKFFNPDGIVFLDDNFDPRELTQDFYDSRRSAVEENFLKVLDLQHPLEMIVDDFVPDSRYLTQGRWWV